MVLARWEPFRLRKLGSEMDRLFGHFLGHEGQPRARDGWFRPAIEVVEDAESLTVRAEIPGVERDELDVKIDGRLLTISGTKEEKREQKADEADEKERTYHIYEARYGSFQRSLELPEHIDTEKVDAEFADGVLTVRLSKKEEAKPRQLTIDVK